MTRLVITLILIIAALSGCGDNLTFLDVPGAYEGQTPQALECVPNLDGRIDSVELPTAIGVPVSYLISAADASRTIDSVGEATNEGGRLWDWSAAASDDGLARLSARSIETMWYAATFPEAEFAAPFDAGGTIDGIFFQDEQALWLLGLASVEAEPAEGQTLLVYSEPVAVTRFPIEVGRSWTSVGEVRNSMVRGLPYAGRDTYTVEVSRAGELALPDLRFTQALQILTHVSLEPAVGFPTSRRQVSYFFECFGEVARATSEADETDPDFTTAAEQRRLSLLQ